MSFNMMKAVVVEKYGPVESLVPRTVPDPGEPKGRDLLIQYALNKQYNELEPS